MDNCVSSVATVSPKIGAKSGGAPETVWLNKKTVQAVIGILEKDSE